MSEKNSQSNIIKAERPGGFLDFLPGEYLAREKMLRIIEEVYRSYGFDPIETPMIEFEEVLAGETSDTGKNIFRVKSRIDSKEGADDRNLALRFDQTVPFARLLAANPYDSKKRIGIRLPWRRMVVGPVFRGEKPQSGRYRQFYQFDADIAGTASMIADAEIIAMMFRTLKKLGIERFQIYLNNRKILNGLAELTGIKNFDQPKIDDITKNMMRILDKIDKIGLDSVLDELCREPSDDFDPAPNLGLEGLERIKIFLGIKGSNEEKLKQCRDLFKTIGIAQEGIKELSQILEYLASMNIPKEFVEINFSIARGLDYYTGPVMETILLDAPEFGSILSGGRYNDLVSRFTGQELPAVGASIGVDRLFAALKHIGKIDLNQQTVTEVMILRLFSNQDSFYLDLAQQIRDLGRNTEICLIDDLSFKAQFNFAVSRGVKFVVIYGENEKEKNIIQIKNLETRNQQEISKDTIEKYFSEN